jgi:glycosyltransferase involved in cell wall biosynthesis
MWPRRLSDQENTMAAVRFSIVIPTRERADTLRFALRTCLDQTFDDYEVIVSDNHSSPATKVVVDEAASPKVRYVRTAEPLAMSANWEFGVSHARGEYVTVLGDDDGLLPHALAELDGLVRAHAPKAIRWEMALYTWPTIALPGQGDYLRVPLESAPPRQGDVPLERGLIERDGAEAIGEVVAFRAFYTDLPMVYNGVVHRDVLDELRNRAQRIFAHPSPDVYSGFAIARAAGRFLSLSVPMTVCGLSRASNGVAGIYNRGRTSIEREYHALNAKEGLWSDPTVPDLPVYPEVVVADTFAVAKRLLFPEWDVGVDRQKLARACLNGTRATEGEWPAVVEAVRRSFDDAPELRHWFDTELASTPYRTVPPVQFQLRSSRLGLYGGHLHLDAAAFGVRDVAAAVRLCAQVVNSNRPIRSGSDAGVTAAVLAEAAGWDPRDRAVLALHLSASDDHTALAAVRAELAVERERAAAERERVAALTDHARFLQATCDDRQGAIRQLEALVHETARQLAAERRWSLKRPFRRAKRLLTALIRPLARPR